MHPAPSVITFTVLSGAGYGLLALIGLFGYFDALPGDQTTAILVSLAALGLVSAGLLSSTLHLGRPDRAWRAFSQWRSSWLSREGVAAIITFIPALAAAYGWIMTGVINPMLGLLLALCAGITVFCTGMIYACLKTVPQWHRGWVPLVYLALALMTGGLWATALTALLGHDVFGLELLAFMALLLGWAVKWLEITDRANIEAQSTAGTALGLEAETTVKMIEPPHQGRNYLLREMAFEVGRKHAEKLRKIMWLCGAAWPLLMLIVVLLSPAGAIAGFAALLALIFGMAGCFIERWLFFAEAQHKVTLYYGANAV